MAAIVSSRINLLQASSPRFSVVGLGLGQSIDYSQVTNTPALGTLSAKDKVDLVNDVVGQLASSSITGLGALAQLDRINLATQTTGSIDASTQVTNLGGLAFANQIAANQIGAGTLAAGVIYAGSISANNITAGTFNSSDSNFTLTLGTSSYIDSLGSSYSIGSKLKRSGSGSSIGPALAVEDTSSSPSTYAMSCHSQYGGAAKFSRSDGSYGTNVVYITGTDTTSGDALKIDGSFSNAGVNISHSGSGYGLYIGNSTGAYITGNLTVTGSISGTVGYATNAGYANNAGWAVSAGAGTQLVNGGLNLTLQSDGNLVLYYYGSPLWFTGTSVSDRTQKHILGDTIKDGLNTINSLSVVDFMWNEDSHMYDGGLVHTGFIAQDVKELFPDAVGIFNDMNLLKKEELIPLMVKAIQDLSAEVTALKAQLTPGPV